MKASQIHMLGLKLRQNAQEGTGSGSTGAARQAMDYSTSDVEALGWILGQFKIVSSLSHPSTLLGPSASHLFLIANVLSNRWQQLTAQVASIRIHAINSYLKTLATRATFWDDTALVELIAGPLSPLKTKNANGSIELILGLKPSGASHLLLDDSDTREVASAKRLPYPNPSSAYTAYDFESVSPIVFTTKDQLSQKMKSLRPKKGGAPSQANRNYPDGSLDLYRGAFEHGRLFYRILNNLVDPRKYGVDDVSWTHKTRVLSFVFNVKGLEFRPSVERKSHPDVLDFGFCEAHLPSVTPNLSTAKHITNLKNKLLGRRQPKRTFSHGITEGSPFEELPQRIQALFKDHQGNKSRNPLILLVCREEESLNILRNLGVDTSGWRTGIKDLLLPDSGRRVRSSPQRQGSYHSRQSSYSGNSSSPVRPQGRNPSRSRSPSHGRATDWRQASASASSSSLYRYDQKELEAPPPGTRESYPPVYVLDVRELYVKLMQTTNVDGVVDIARFFQLSDDEGWCAGNEAATIINIWKEMVSSVPIDEQRDLRRTVLDPSSSLDASSNPTPAPEPEAYVYDSDDDQDPNEIVAQPQKEAGKTDDPYGFDETDSESD